MADSATPTGRPLSRSLEPLPGESLGGYLLRLAHRLHLSPIRLARRIGVVTPATTRLACRLLLDLESDGFARMTRLSNGEALSLALVPWADRYPPIARALRRSVSGSREDWLFNDFPRYCPQCLAGDGSPDQQGYGGPWKKLWHLPIVFACPDHRVFLRHGCPRPHQLRRTITDLISQTADSTLHPAKCRLPAVDRPRSKGRTGPSCGVRLDQLERDGEPRPDLTTLSAQQRILEFLGPGHTAEDAVAYFTDLRVLAAFLCASWPLGHELVPPGSREAVDAHVHTLGAGQRQNLDQPPRDSVATAGILTAATRLREALNLRDLLDQHTQAVRNSRPSRIPWTRVFDRHESTCSALVRQAAAPAVRAYRRTGPRGTRLPDRTGGYRVEHIPAFLEERWYQEHLTPLQFDGAAKSVRRLAAVRLVQQASGRAQGDAADFLGINPAGGQFTATNTLLQWLKNGQDAFTTALHNLAEELDRATDPTNYQRRREVLRDWSLPSETWNEIITRLPPVPGPVRPNLDDRVRQEASAFVWAYVTCGEPLYAPRHIEAAQPPDTRQSWQQRRANTWFQLSRPHALNHYAALRGLLCQHGDALIEKIESGTSMPIR
ncbi:TniQ family protein [Streptomyces prunicolor]|uniref:TniQ family protein n=1 Tax=Streptomyces prunicolor TaxID=67348 RepID=UPI00224D81FC|nr:TniQ family protein [Streptomyces prunicolor]MCX5239027.1 TniQ family protein [Streptomyces prunicolor]MCX5240463.1 TniQ family protein [Streptomyces prunicolor]